MRLRYLGGGFCFVGTLLVVIIAFTFPGSFALTLPLGAVLVMLGVHAFSVRRPGGHGPVRTAVGWTLMALAITWGILMIVAAVEKDTEAAVCLMVAGIFTSVAGAFVLGKPSFRPMKLRDDEMEKHALYAAMANCADTPYYGRFDTLSDSGSDGE